MTKSPSVEYCIAFCVFKHKVLPVRVFSDRSMTFAKREFCNLWWSVRSGRDKMPRGIYDEGAVEFMRGARELRKNENSGIFRILGGDIFLRHQIHAVPQRRHEADVGGTIQPRDQSTYRNALELRRTWQKSTRAA